MPRLPKSPKRGLALLTLGLGVRLAVFLEELGACCCCGLRSGIIPRPAGAGVASRCDGCTGFGDGLREGKRLPWEGRRTGFVCNGEAVVLRRTPLCRRSGEKLIPDKLLCMIANESPSCD